MKLLANTILLLFIWGMHSFAAADNWDQAKIIRGQIAVHAQSEDCYVWVSEIVSRTITKKYVSEATWTGECVDGWVSGKGVLKLEYSIGVIEKLTRNKDGTSMYNEHDMKISDFVSEFEGEFVKGVRNGFGTYSRVRIDMDGETKDLRYEGEFDNHLPNGQGKMFFYEMEKVIDLDSEELFSMREAIRKYEGEFKDGDAHGTGVYYFSPTERYEGKWKNGLTHGKGKLYLLNGERYEGKFDSGLAKKGKCYGGDNTKVKCRQKLESVNRLVWDPKGVMDNTWVRYKGYHVVNSDFSTAYIEMLIEPIVKDVL